MKKFQLQSGNYYHEDGRIYEHGDGISKTISPYANDFLSNIEGDIANLVVDFVAKGYLTYSSCAGHQAVKRRFISIAFPSKERARQFIYDVRKLYDHPLISYDIKYATDYYNVDYDNVRANTDYLNGLFSRGYSEYFFVELSIGKNTPPSLKNAFKIAYKFLMRDYVTQELHMNLISGLPSYDM